MKKPLLLIAALFAFTFANAQSFKFGIKGGVNYSSVTGGDKEDYIGDADYKTSYHFGIMPKFQFGGILGLKPELLYTSKGFQLNEKFNNVMGGTTDVEIKTNLNYLSLPILMNIDAGPIFFELGPEVAYLLATTGENKIEATNSAGDKVTDDKAEYITNEENYADFDFGFVAGIGVNLPAGFGLGVRYNGGFMSIYADEKPNSKNVNVKNSTFMLSLNYTFGGNDTE